MSTTLPSNDVAASPFAQANESQVARAVPATTSFNFSVAKVAAIFTVTAGHWFTGTILWIPVTFGLFLFAFSSGFFTSTLYGPDVDRASFWRKKLERLGLRYWIVLAFLALLAAFQGKTVIHWHTALHFLGLSGLLNWGGVPSRSALGLGLWFFTLLLLFYLAYPYLARAFRFRKWALPSLTFSFLLVLYLQEHVKVGHELWLTAFGFVAGVGWGMHQQTRLSARMMLVLTMTLVALLLQLNLLGIRLANTLLIGAGATSLALWLSLANVPRWPVLLHLAALEKYVLEIFMVHQYLFVRPTGNDVLDFILSLVLILIVSIALGELVDRLSARVFRKKVVVRP